MRCFYAPDCSECCEPICRFDSQPPADPYDPYYYPPDLDTDDPDFVSDQGV